MVHLKREGRGENEAGEDLTARNIDEQNSDNGSGGTDFYMDGSSIDIAVFHLVRGNK